MSIHPLPKVSEVYTRFPISLINHLRQVVDSASPSDTFACYCNLLEWLTNYLNSLANSVYIDRSADAIDERLEKQLRSTPVDPTFGLSVAGLRAFAASTIDFVPKLPELHGILSAKSLPIECVRLTQAFKLIRQAREDYEVPPGRLTNYLTKNLPPDEQLGKVRLEAFLSALSPFRNKGHGHQAEETWFPRDRIMYEIVLSFLHPAVDELLTWTPFGELLSRYEIVRSERAQLQRDGERGAVISRPKVSDAVAPLGESFLRLGAAFQAVPAPCVVRRARSERGLLVWRRCLHRRRRRRRATSASSWCGRGRGRRGGHRRFAEEPGLWTGPHRMVGSQG